ncbi:MULTISPECIES: toxin-antitoxin system, antitoxin component, Xre family protein [Cyanophyceae]|uniref:toxin-antitoxin system, antitoxin component, Xre family protein n=1 Tax=Cyanophyceae TaxID=3028117 RepID=UPI001682CA6D|nr:MULTISPECIES: toxin-antitoxin system, antitoxin component, Xre family protein [Cyanophyceae]MBD1919066.1 toxin-antitoxin system, antitoxin component, Xre family protein [Phormidium sp. FACHB-77]MBD2033067.1 toxin-antitoxin system, antitoxin component, Xre family protein [Phormidium sp. FACHB-322]MBD2053995.1 toxin-antitoxin system, antitoxin component, Xre family protein [Leptolyngbya sp. FACHB-60]
MQALSEQERQLLDKIRQFSPLQIAEVEDFVDFLSQRYSDRQLVAASAQASEPSLAQVWDNPEDAAYDDL